MALNLSTLTNASTSGDVLQEVFTTADFLEPCPVLRNLSRGSNKGGDAKQDVALNQPRSLPLIKNPAGKLGGYLYIPNVSNNYATGPSVTIGANETWEAEVDVVMAQFGDHFKPMGGGDWLAGFGLLMYSGGNIRVFSKGIAGASNPSGITLGTPVNIKYGFGSIGLYVKINDVIVSQSAASQASSITHTLELNQQTLGNVGNYAIQKAKLTVNSAVVFDCDFNGSTSIRHGDTKFQASVGGPVSLTRAGQDPVTVVKKNILRFDGTNDGLRGLFANNINGGYMFAAFSVLGDGGESYARVFTTSLAGTGNDYDGAGAAFLLRNAGTTNLATIASGGTVNIQGDRFDDARGDILHVVKIENESQTSDVNNASFLTNNRTTAINSNEFNIAFDNASSSSACIDLEFLALFSVDSVPDEATASKIRNYINDRKNVFYRWDTDGYYFYDAQKAPVGAISSGSSAWSGRIVGSDNGDSASIESTQSTANDQPVSDGYVVTFADNSDHLDIPSTTQAGWQICGTSLGTFVYRINGTTAVTELNLLGNLGHASYRKTGQSYGMILLPESATGADIESARRLLIDRGAADGTTTGSIFANWYDRDDIVEFKHINTSSVTYAEVAWWGCGNLESFPALNLNNCGNLVAAWQFCSSLSDFGAIDASNTINFSNAWQGTSALTSFPAGAKLGTEANNVNFDSAWRSSGLTSFSTPLPTASNVSSAWFGCTSLESFTSSLPTATTVSFAWYNSSLSSFNGQLPLATTVIQTWSFCGFLTSFDTPLPSASNLNQAWRNCTSLSDFSADVFANWNPSSIVSGVFNTTWANCPLTAQSVENILVSIDASGKYATSTGASGGSALADAGIDIDYNTATGSLSAATNSAVTSLKSKGWSIIVNNVTL